MARATVPVTVRWADLDAYRHVNNVAMMQLLEEARIALFWHGARQGGEAAGEGSPEAMSSTAERDTATFVVHQEVEYITPLGYPSGPLPIQVWVSHVGGSSIEVNYEIPNLNGGIAARAATTVVMVDLETGKPRRLREDERGALAELHDEPVEIRRRR